MRKGMRFFLLTLPAMLIVGWGSALWAQESAPAQPAAKPAVDVPADVQQKAKTYKGSEVPPKPLVREADGHWTPYTLPEKPPEGTAVYVIQKGDTLSGLAQQKLGTWLLWPQIWDKNGYIKDAHWIYPGDPLLMEETKPNVVSEAAPLAPQEMQTQEAGEAKPPAPRGGGFEIEEEAPTPPVNAYDVYCSGYITKSFRKPHLTILSNPNPERFSHAKGDVVYLNEGKDEGVEPGMVFAILYPGQRVSHPVSGKEIGQYIRRIGQIKVLAVQAHASIAEITQSCDEVVDGMVLVPWRAIPIPWDIQRSPQIPLQVEASNKPQGRVVWTEDRLETVALSNVIYVDLGSESHLIPGDKIWIYRYPATQGTITKSTTDLFRQQKLDAGPKDLFRLPKVGKYKEEPKKAEAGKATAAPAGPTRGEKEAAREEEKLGTGPESIRLYVAEGVVLTTEPTTACVKIITSDSEVTLGDRVQVE